MIINLKHEPTGSQLFPLMDYSARHIIMFRGVTLSSGALINLSGKMFPAYWLVGNPRFKSTIISTLSPITYTHHNIKLWLSNYDIDNSLSIPLFNV
jgi:hypothetical protein